MPSDETYHYRDLRPNLRHREYGDYLASILTCSSSMNMTTAKRSV